jgi:PBP1b-binding outer membrane lipoprotein LpoB
MKLCKLLLPAFMAVVLMVGCKGKEADPAANVAPTPAQASFEPPTKIRGGVAVPENMTIDEGPVKDVEK